MSHEYTTKQVADLLNVSESSVKRWCDKGLIETQRTGGGHRRISQESLTAFLQTTSQGLSTEQLNNRLKIFDADSTSPVGLGLESSNDSKASDYDVAGTRGDDWLLTQKDRLFAALMSGNEQETRRLITQHFSIRESVADVADELLAPCFQEIGKSWANGKVDVFQERRAVGITLQVLLELRRLLPSVDHGKVALGCSLSGDDYLLPTTIVEMVLRQNSFQATNLGTNIPFQNLSKAIQTYHPTVIWISVSHIDDRQQFAEGLEEFLRVLPSECNVLVGGRLAHWVELPNSNQLHQFSNMRKLEEFLKNNYSGDLRNRKS